MGNTLEIKLLADQKYKHITVIVLFREYTICQLNKDKGIENIEVKFFNEVAFYEDRFYIKLPLSYFRETLKEAEKVLLRETMA